MNRILVVDGKLGGEFSRRSESLDRVMAALVADPNLTHDDRRRSQ